ncbi:MAG: hypothetical protein EBU84_17905, partial [Actinobacteria bacterium]|nr:hypothetical protein [Actinomycetota bacterium]
MASKEIACSVDSEITRTTPETLAVTMSLADVVELVLYRFSIIQEDALVQFRDMTGVVAGEIQDEIEAAYSAWVVPAQAELVRVRDSMAVLGYEVVVPNLDFPKNERYLTLLLPRTFDRKNDSGFDGGFLWFVRKHYPIVATQAAFMQVAPLSEFPFCHLLIAYPEQDYVVLQYRFRTTRGAYQPKDITALYELHRDLRSEWEKLKNMREASVQAELGRRVRVLLTELQLKGAVSSMADFADRAGAY